VESTLTIQEELAFTITDYIVLIAAWNEEAAIADTVKNAFALEPTPARVVVVVNNTTDATAAVAREAGALVFDIGANPGKKAGALNYGLNLLEKSLRTSDAVLVMDADTRVSSHFAHVAMRTLNLDENAGAVGTVFLGRETSTLIGTMQQMEYFRYKREIRQHGSEAFVLSGTASMIRWTALAEIKRERLRGVKLPRGESYYDTVSLTEDNELTFALKTLGWDCPVPGVESTTDVMDTVKAVYHQRHRWYIGALGNIWHYGRRMPWFLRWVYWRQQAGLFMALLMFGLIAGANALSIAAYGIGFHWSTFTAIAFMVLLMHLVTRTVTVWRMGVRYRIPCF
jgi:cellulose synthase/poly-beta-1,6-N-acetylglucosamine synthase-like glycosyltransferase